MPSSGTLIAIIVLLLIAVFTVPFLFGANTGDSERTDKLTVNESVEFTDNLEVNMTDVDQTSNDVTVEYTNLDDFNMTNTTVGVGNTTEISLSGETITVTLDSIRTPRTAVVTTAYPAMFAWDAPARNLSENIGLILILLAFAIGGWFLLMAVDL